MTDHRNVSASGLLAALAERHKLDVFVPECKNGPTSQGNHRRMDAWVMLKTWSPVTMIGYEIKVSRSDWRRDQKLDEYAGLCHLLNIVAPKGVVPIEELPEGVGLLELAGTGTGQRLITKRRASRREIDVPSALLIYVLMSRTTIDARNDHAGNPRWRRDELEAWVNGKECRSRLHHALSQKIRSAFDACDEDRRRAVDTATKLEHINARIRELGFDPTQQVQTWQVERRLRALDGAIPDASLHQIERAERELATIRQSLQALKQRPEALDGAA